MVRGLRVPGAMMVDVDGTHGEGGSGYVRSLTMANSLIITASAACDRCGFAIPGKVIVPFQGIKNDGTIEGLEREFAPVNELIRLDDVPVGS